MKQSQSLSNKNPVSAKHAAPKHTEIDKDDVVRMGLAALSTYFGVSFERAMSQSLNPGIKKLVSEFHTYLQDQ